MKKTVLLLALFAGVAFGASAQCTPDTTHFTNTKHAYPDTLPCFMPGQFSSGQVSIQIPATQDAHDFLSAVPAGLVTATIDSVRIDAISGEPAGISSVSTPSLGTWIYPNRYACAIFSGSTTASAGNYPLTITGVGCGHFFAPGTGTRYDSCISTTLSRFVPYSLKVCTVAGINEVQDGVSLSIYPNPNQGNFTVSISTDDRIAGNVTVIDQLGRTVYTQSVDVVGTKQIPLSLGNIAPGVYMLAVNTANGKTVKQFSIK